MNGFQAGALALLLVSVLLAGCSSSGSTGSSAGKSSSSSRYTLSQDRPPSGDIDLSAVVEPVPHYEPRSRGGNRNPYTVWGKSYHVLDTAQGYDEEGIASWYGEKFHGHKTSNGEIYNMYTFSAAHKHLPLPSFVRVTNLENGRSLIVRVNDRGPFHGERIIDLSYAAASRLDMLKTGTARVRVENVMPMPGETPRAAASSPAAPENRQPQELAANEGYYLQAGAYSQKSVAEGIAQQLQEQVSQPAFTQAVPVKGRTIYRVRIGPYSQKSGALSDLERLKQGRFPDTLLVRAQ